MSHLCQITQSLLYFIIIELFFLLYLVGRSNLALFYECCMTFLRDLVDLVTSHFLILVASGYHHARIVSKRSCKISIYCINGSLCLQDGDFTKSSEAEVPYSQWLWIWNHSRSCDGAWRPGKRPLLSERVSFLKKKKKNRVSTESSNCKLNFSWLLGLYFPRLLGGYRNYQVLLWC